MPYPVEKLIEGHDKPICVQLENTAREALLKMVEHEYSQLPVVDDNDRPLGMVTSESILRALNNLQVTIDQIGIQDALVEVKPFGLDDDVFETLDRLKESNAALIVDMEGKLVGIVTGYDTTEYLRKRSEDLMIVEDIEGMIKDLIHVAFLDSTGEIDQGLLTKAIENITSSNQELKSKYAKALNIYLEHSGQSATKVRADSLEISFTELIPKQKAREFDELGLNEYIELLLHKERWDFYCQIFDIPSNALRVLFDGVRQTRNQLAHFQGEITNSQRDQLKYCSEWLSRRSNAIPISIPAFAQNEINKHVVVRDQVTVRDSVSVYIVGDQNPSDNIVPIDETMGPRESRYAPLATWLQSRSRDEERFELSFSDIERIINFDLPQSARKHRAWWANDPIGHSHARQWVDVGWRTSYVNMTEERVTFARIKERENAYITFYSEILNRLRESATFPVKDTSPGGQNWMVVYGLPMNGPQGAVLSYAFTRYKKFRVELYIDTGDRERNKATFDALIHHKEEIERIMDAKLSWERIDDKRASRIALYRNGFITDTEANLVDLQVWGVEQMIRFYEVIEPLVNNYLETYSGDSK